jgi:hypothetical protein
MAIITRKISRTLFEQKPYEAWNAFVNLIAKEKYEDLVAIQQIAHLCFWYDSEVQNGGHMQFFENRGTLLLNETLSALRSLGGECQRGILDQARGLVLTSPGNSEINTVEDYVVVARSGEFAALDTAYHACKPTIETLLGDYFDRHRDDFIQITDDV